MKSLNAVGLDKEKSKVLAEKLNELLANYSVLYMNTRGYHWNIKGDKFFELHQKFEEIYTDLQEKIDELAERVVTLGVTPYHSFTDYLNHADIQEKKDITDGRQGVDELLDSFQLLLIRQRELLNLSADAGDEGTNALMSDYVTEQEKLVWMLSAFLNK